MKWPRQDKWLIEYFSVGVPCILVNTIRILHCCLNVCLTANHRLVVFLNMSIPPIPTTRYKNTVLIPASDSCHVYTFTLPLVVVGIYSLSVQIRHGTIVLAEMISLLQKYNFVNQAYQLLVRRTAI
jgi:hypothetical protein